MERAPRKFSIRWSGDDLPYEVVGGLFVEWIQHLSAQRLDIHQYPLGQVAAQQETTHTFGDPARMFSVVSSGASNQWHVSSIVGLNEAEVLAVIEAALERTEARDTGEPVIYSTEITTGDLDIGHATFSTNFLRLLSSQVLITGDRRLGSSVLLGFTSEAVEGPVLFAPRNDVRATIFVPGPAAGDLAGRTARGIAEIVAATCAFALGRPVTHTPVTFPEEDTDRIAAATARRLDSGILTLARNHVSLDIFEDLSARGSVQATERARGALLAYHAALQQNVPDLAILLYVISIEALLAPPENWPQVTKRFITGTQELCPEAIEEILARPDLERGLDFPLRGGQARQRRDLLNRVYELRSLPVHYGLGLSGGGGVLALGEPEGTRVAITEQLAAAAILGYLAAPRCSIVGRHAHEATTAHE